ncbi:MAG: prepilin-type N-terminal cleavage/methylation domain-containing protein [Aquipseudomonas alcaligenes]|uniref:Type II secretion system protein H n=1 Tax=Aquipseudomonas alcaligenes TaxID=43263 RepID=A0A5C7WD23_AQUAC|nr:MAG: prepilin-type N-terminal cleavage/methylation domain-containing protein [Pseudomonas alcaligenes]
MSITLPQRFKSSPSSAGFTLVELMVVLAIIAIVAMVALPNYGPMMQSSRETSASNELLGAMLIARSEAVTRRTGVTVCASNDQSTCSGSWTDGAVVRTNAGDVIRTLPPVEDVTISGNSISFSSDGRSAGGTLTVGGHSVTVNTIGRAKVE